jgi:hypothetical protein
VKENLDNLARIWILLGEGFGFFLVKDVLQEIWICCKDLGFFSQGFDARNLDLFFWQGFTIFFLFVKV